MIKTVKTFKANHGTSIHIQQTIKSSIKNLDVIERLLNGAKVKSTPIFITPLEIEKREMHWGEFYSHCSKSLSLLKKEVKYLMLNMHKPLIDIPEKVLRHFCSANHSCLLLLKGLENFLFKIREDSKGQLLMQETIFIAQQMLAMIFTDLNKRTYSDSAGKNISETQNESILDISLNSLPESKDNVSSVINPSSIREKLFSIAKSYELQNKCEKNGGSSYEEETFYPSNEEWRKEERIQLIHDSLSPKLRRRSVRIDEGLTDDSEEFSSASESRSDDNYKPLPRRGKERKAKTEILSEQMADAVFQKILPYVSNNKEIKSESSVVKSSALSRIEVDDLSETLKTFSELQEKLDKLEMAAQIHEEFLSREEKKSTSESDCLDLDKAVRKAKAALKKWDKSLHPLLCPAYNVEVPSMMVLGARRKAERDEDGKANEEDETTEEEEEEEVRGSEGRKTSEIEEMKTSQKEAEKSLKETKFTQVDFSSYETEFESESDQVGSGTSVHSETNP